MEIEKTMRKGQLDSRDRLSELPESILHDILSFLEFRDACRTTTLSKMWLDIWASNPVLEFRPEYFKKETLDSRVTLTTNKHRKEYYDEGFIQAYAGFIENTIQRYSMQKHAISKLTLEIPKPNYKVELMIEKWLQIAVQLKVQVLDFSILVENLRRSKEKLVHFKLPEFLFSVSSLLALRCRSVDMPYWQTLNLSSLVYLELHDSIVDEHMLQRMISSCPLIELRLSSCSFQRETLVNNECMVEGQVTEKTPSLGNFYYDGNFERWPFEMDVGAFRNLRMLEISNSRIKDAILESLISKLTMLETLVLVACDRLKSIRISSSRFKNFELVKCEGLRSVIVNAPQLISFLYYGNEIPDLPLSVICHEQCDSRFHIDAFSQVVSPSWLIELKKFLKETNIFRFLEIDWICFKSEIEFGEDELKTIIDLGSPCDLKELKLPFMCDGSSLALLADFVDGLFWCCHPEVLIVRARLTSESKTNAESVLKDMKERAKSWRHPLKNIEVKAVDSSRLLTDSIMEMQFRLHW